ncbi:MAG: hypothetical protein Fur0046_34200 [Cyanobacteria bacterium J069]|nr:MAG: hypothetical protein D6742_01295 [Cyanobacteria bacterium J069]
MSSAESQAAVSSGDRPPQNWTVSLLLWAVWIVYVGYLLLSDLPPGPSLLHTSPATLQEAIALSLNFGLVLPAVFPSVAPVLHPMLEALFNLTVGWGLLFWGFALDGRGQRVPIFPFLVGTAFLTNVFYLPWLALRRANPEPPSLPLSRWERVSESRLWPLMLGAIALCSLGWAVFARSDFGDWPTRWASMMAILKGDRLAYSFAVDLLVFWLFQGWLVPDDMARRQWVNPGMLWTARLLPFVGLLTYMVCRPSFKSPTF